MSNKIVMSGVNLSLHYMYSGPIYIVRLDYDLHRCRVHYRDSGFIESTIIHAHIAKIIRLHNKRLFRIVNNSYDSYYIVFGAKYTVNRRFSVWEVTLIEHSQPQSRTVEVNFMNIIIETCLIHSAFQYCVLIENKNKV